MILIISSEDDKSTNDVIDWLRHYKQDFIRISEKDQVFIESFSMHGENIDLDLGLKGQVIPFRSLKSIWYRRGLFSPKTTQFSLSLESHEEETAISNQLFNDQRTALQFLVDLYGEKSINHQGQNSLNKLETLRKCALQGMHYPKTLVTGKKRELEKFFEENGVLINKNITPGVFIKKKGNYLQTATQLVTQKEIAQLPADFPVMLFQERIKKAFELRVFFLHNDFYASAIMSQLDEKTALDFRNYNMEKPNRCPPYVLPKTIESKLNKLMFSLGLNSGSIDLLVDEQGEYYFLEVNPIGQFFQVSYPCNYYLEQKLAKSLINGTIKRPL